MTGLGDSGAEQMQLSALKKIYATNVMKFGNGEMGAANGMAADGSIIPDNEQAQEVWVGTTFGLAALLLSEGLKDEAFHTPGEFITSFTRQKATGSERPKPGTTPAISARRCTCDPQPSGRWKWQHRLLTKIVESAAPRLSST